MSAKFDLDGYRLSKHATLRLLERTKLSEKEFYDFIQVSGSVQYVGFAHDFGEFNTSVRFFLFFSLADYQHYIIVSDVSAKVIMTILYLHYYTAKYGEIDNSVLHSSRRAGINIRRSLTRDFLVTNNKGIVFFDTDTNEEVAEIADKGQAKKIRPGLRIFASYVEFDQEFVKIPMRRQLFKVDNDRYPSIDDMLNHQEFRGMVREKLAEIGVKYLDFCKIEIILKREPAKLLAKVDANVLLDGA